MDAPITITQKQLPTMLLHISPIRPIFIWGAPGIGKSAIVEKFANDVGIPVVSLLGTQLAPEDLIGVPQIKDGKSEFFPPAMIAREEPYCLFLDELNASSPEVAKAFYSLIHERRIGSYHLPKGSIIIGAGNRSHDNAIVKQMSSALLNRMVHVHLSASAKDWLEWAYKNEIHPWIVQYIETRPDHLWSKPPKHEEPFSTPRSWHMLSDSLYEFGENITPEWIEVLAYGLLTPAHAGQFKAFVKNIESRYQLASILKGEEGWPRDPKDRDVLYFLTQSFRAQLVKELPEKSSDLSGSQKQLSYQAKSLLTDLAGISLEMAQMVVGEDEEGQSLPNWFRTEVVRDIPRLAQAKDNG